MEKTLRRVIALIVAAAFLIPLLTPETFAASELSLSGGESVKGGDIFTLTVTYGGGDVGRVDGQLNYDTDKLTYISGGSSSGNTGYIQLKDFGSGSVSFKIKFQAVAEGSTNIEVTTNEMYSLDEEYLDNPAASKTIKISGNAGSKELITETRSSEEPVESTAIEGVDEKDDEKEDGPDINVNAVLMISAAVLAVIIGVITAVLLRRRKK